MTELTIFEVMLACWVVILFTKAAQVQSGGHHCCRDCIIKERLD